MFAHKICNPMTLNVVRNLKLQTENTVAIFFHAVNVCLYIDAYGHSNFFSIKSEFTVHILYYYILFDIL